MSNTPLPLPSDQSGSDVPAPPARISRFAITAMILGILGMLSPGGCGGVVLGFAGIILGSSARARITRHPRELAGGGYANIGLVTGMLAILISFLWPVLNGSVEMNRRAHCATNIRCIVMSLTVYSQFNVSSFPCVPNTAHTRRYSLDTAIDSGTTNPDDAMSNTPGGIFGGKAAAVDGNPAACLWLLNLTRLAQPKLFVCKSDFFASPSPLKTSTGTFYLNFQNCRSLSYSIAYPWDASGRASPYWTPKNEATLPLVSDMALAGSDNTAGRGPKSYNSPLHGGEGQNVGFNDMHVDFVNKVDVGQSHDNIFANAIDGSPTVAGVTISVTPAATAVSDVSASNADPSHTGTTAPFNIFMVPVRGTWSANWR